MDSGIRRPLIGVTGPDEGGIAAWHATRINIWLQGGRAVRITPSAPRKIDELHGLVIGGGADVDPARYKEELLRTIRRESRHGRKLGLTFLSSVAIWLIRRVLSRHGTRPRGDLKRDQLEFDLLENAVARGMPTLGICRGSQLMNVHFGGSLFQEIESFYTEEPKLRTIRPRKLIHVESGTGLSRILNRVRTKVNSLHDQSVKEVAPVMRVSAKESNGVIQAIEHITLPFMLGLQWHPEFLPFKKEQRRIFHHLVEAARVHGLLHAGLKQAHGDRRENETERNQIVAGRSLF